MQYIEVKVYTSVPGLEVITDLLLERGISGAVIGDPTEVDELLEKKNGYEWDYVDTSVLDLKNREPMVTIYFENEKENLLQIERLKLDLLLMKEQEKDTGMDLGRLFLEENLMDDGQWKDKWKECFKTSKITEKLVIKPTWEEYTADKGELVIELDPGTAFGTGTHETTSLCLLLLEKHIKGDCAVLDVGCGSGILSIGAALLGSKNVLGVEIDPEAVIVAEENIRCNNVEDSAKVIEGNLIQGIDIQADIVVANLMADLVMELSKSVMRHLKPQGIYISSGILIEKEEIVKNAIEEAGFEVIEILEKGEWCAIAAMKR